MTARRFFELLGVVALGLGIIPGYAQGVSANDSSARCNALATTDFSLIPDAPAQVTAAKAVEPSGNTNGYCEVGGYVAPSVGFLLRLPSNRWNGKLVEIGCGGPCGTLAHIEECGDPLRKGYACIVSDGGHKSDDAEPMKWSYQNPEAVIEYLVRASHVTALAGKAIVQRYYDQPPNKSYFMGCSGGGIQAMWEAQRFPWDFDGIVAGHPALHLTGIWTNWLWANRALSSEGKTLLEQADLEFLHQAVLAKCDMNDGVNDGVIGDPRQCRFNPADVQCTAGKTGRCLTAQQVQAVEKIYGGATTSRGEQIALPIAMRGSERTWLRSFGGSTGSPTPFYRYLRDWYLYSIFPPSLGPDWRPENFDFDRDYERLGAMEALEPNNADLREFKARGGKLLMHTGWNDAIEGVLNTVGYYETAEKIMGSRAATQDFFRLFVTPGMEHCSGGDGAFAVDYMSYLEAWAEKGEAPAKLIGSHVKLEDLMDEIMRGNQAAAHTLERRLRFPLDPANVEFSRPIYPYPTEAKYLGHGDIRDATSFGPVWKP